MTQRVLPGVIRRAVGHHEYLRARKTRLARGLGKPGVLANDAAEADAVDVEYAGRNTGREVAFLVEHRIVGELLLAVDVRDLSFADHDERVVAKASLPLGKTDEGDGPCNGG